LFEGNVRATVVNGTRAPLAGLEDRFWGHLENELPMKKSDDLIMAGNPMASQCAA